jgi:23S rRNA (uracil1939-C5)-methyltransferase
MVVVVFARNETEKIDQLLTFISEKFAAVTSLMYVVNTKQNDIITDLEIQPWKGKDYLLEKMPPATAEGKELSFRIGPVSFYQTNPLQAYHLYKTAFEFASFEGNELVYDLYCGIGTITNFVAPYVKKVVGVEYVEAAINDARINSQLNDISNTVFYAGDLAKVLNADFILQNGVPDVIITDPPRNGMHEKVVNQILTIRPAKIIYVSCNSATQARDIALLSTEYIVADIQPVDMFPHTHHIENVVLLTLKA